MIEINSRQHRPAWAQQGLIDCEDGTTFRQSFGNTWLLFLESVRMGYGNKKATEIICLSCPNPVWACGLGLEVRALLISVAGDPGCWKLSPHTHAQAQVKASTLARGALPGNDANAPPQASSRKRPPARPLGGEALVRGVCKHLSGCSHCGRCPGTNPRGVGK